MKILALSLIALCFLSCTAKRQTGITEPPAEQQALDQKEPRQQQRKQGWTGDDTYTVRVTADSLETAIGLARHQILKDIVNVRMRNNSRYTDITKIQEEFKKPLNEGRVIDSIKTDADTEIWFQIRDQGLKEKFERR
jgi:stress-induced morphogen